MTLPEERSRAVLMAGALLAQINNDVRVPLDIRQAAYGIARHFPTVSDVSSLALLSLPGVGDAMFERPEAVEGWQNDCLAAPLTDSTRLTWPEAASSKAAASPAGPAGDAAMDSVSLKESIEQLHAMRTVYEERVNSIYRRLRDETIELDRLAGLDDEAGDASLARKRFAESLTIRERLLAIFGETPRRLRDKTISLEQLAGLDAAEGDTALARKRFAESLAIQERVLAEFGETPERLTDKAISLQQVAGLDNDAGDAASVRTRLAEGLAIYERLLAEFGETPARLQDIVITLGRIADLDMAAGDTASAQNLLAESLEVQERLRLAFGDTPQRVGEKAFVASRLAALDL